MVVWGMAIGRPSQSEHLPSWCTWEMRWESKDHGGERMRGWLIPWAWKRGTYFGWQCEKSKHTWLNVPCFWKKWYCRHRLHWGLSDKGWQRRDISNTQTDPRVILVPGDSSDCHRSNVVHNSHQEKLWYLAEQGPKKASSICNWCQQISFGLLAR